MAQAILDDIINEVTSSTSSEEEKDIIQDVGAIAQEILSRRNSSYATESIGNQSRRGSVKSGGSGSRSRRSSTVVAVKLLPTENSVSLHLKVKEALENP